MNLLAPFADFNEICKWAQECHRNSRLSRNWTSVISYHDPEVNDNKKEHSYFEMTANEPWQFQWQVSQHNVWRYSSPIDRHEISISTGGISSLEVDFLRIIRLADNACVNFEKFTWTVSAFPSYAPPPRAWTRDNVLVTNHFEYRSFLMQLHTHDPTDVISDDYIQSAGK